ncbi:hypothetical protein SESBI_23976 [Sesbania bispinosa]|nr:hypothetical protein SESBI_23976 [Sesbania bispinosa]
MESRVIRSAPSTENQVGQVRRDKRIVRFNPLNRRSIAARPITPPITLGEQYTPLNTKRGIILREVYNANLLDILPPTRCRRVHIKIVGLIRDGYLKSYTTTRGRSGGVGRATQGRTSHNRFGAREPMEDVQEEEVQGTITTIAVALLEDERRVR